MNILAFAPSSIAGAEPLEFAIAAAEAGYDAIGLRLYASPRLPFFPVIGNEPLVRELKRVIADTGLQVLDIFTFYLRPETDLASFQPALETGAAFGGKYALMLGDDPDRSRMTDNFGRLCEMAARAGLSVAAEPAVMRSLATIAQAREMIDAGGASNAIICMDPINFVRAGCKPEELREVPPALFPYTQLNDGFLRPDEPDLAKVGTMAIGLNRRCMPGDGHVPIAEILDAMPSGIPISVEIPIEEVGGDYTVKQWARMTADRTRSFLKDYHARKPAP
jgi:sugar phosphate isomerase/epimerase